MTFTHQPQPKGSTMRTRLLDPRFVLTCIAALFVVCCVVITATSAHAAGGGGGGGGSWPDGHKIVHKADTGYDPAIKTICYDATFDIHEGRSCDQVTRIYIRKGEELWCLRRTETFRRHYIKWMDATGWHTPRRGCDGVLRKD